MGDSSNAYEVLPDVNCNSWSKYEIVSADDPEISVFNVTSITPDETYVIESWYWHKYLSAPAGTIYGNDRPTQWKVTAVGSYYYL